VAHDGLPRLVQRFNTIVNARASSRSLMVMHESGLTFPQMIVLYALAARGAQSLSRLAALTRLSAPAMSQLVDRLVESAYVSRDEDPADRRMRLIALRPKGARLVAQLDRVRRSELDEVLGRLPRRARARLVEILSEIVPRLEETLPG
jgi:DNA-binding MarR family transcriptional regulator